MTRLRAGLGIAFVLALLLAPPAIASAGGGFDLRFHFAAGNGYKITAGGYGATAFISAAKADHPRHDAAWSTYVARGKLSATAVHASFGALGSVAVRFRPSGKITYGKRHRGCEGPDRYTTRFGVFVGSVRFRGEGGYTSARVHRAKGTVVTPRSLACLSSFPGRSSASTVSPAAHVMRFEANLRSGLVARYFAAISRHGKADFSAVSEESAGSLAVYRGAFVVASPLTFAADDALSLAGLTPPAPFSGTGSFQRDPEGGKSWTGPLAVSFPGAPDVPLTGPGFHTQLTRSW